MKKADNVGDVANPEVGVIKDKPAFLDGTDEPVSNRRHCQQSPWDGDAVCPIRMPAMGATGDFAKLPGLLRPADAG